MAISGAGGCKGLTHVKGRWAARGQARTGRLHRAGGSFGADRQLQPPMLAEGRQINTRRCVPPLCAIAGAELLSDLFVAIRYPQRRIGPGILPSRRCWDINCSGDSFTELVVITCSAPDCLRMDISVGKAQPEG